MALGVSRVRLAQAIVSDSVVISSAGGVLSMLLALWTSRVVSALLFEQDAEFLVLAPDFFSIVVASAAGIGIVIACGLLPLFEVRHDRPAAVLGREGGGTSRTSRAVRAGLAIAQMACCCFLVICSGFLCERFRRALQTCVGQRLGQPILAAVDVHPDVEVDLKYFRSVEQTARSFRLEPQRLPLGEVKMDVAGFTSHSLAQFSLPPKAGRLFGFKDQTCPAAIVNEEAAEDRFGGDAAGRSIQDTAGMPVEIIGVVAVRKRGSATQRSRPTIYYDYTNHAGPPLDRIALARFSAPVASRLDTAEFDSNVVSPSYFAAMGFSLVAGRSFPANPSVRGCRVAVVNQQAAELYFGGNAVGAAIVGDIGQRTGIMVVGYFRIIGVVYSEQAWRF